MVTLQIFIVILLCKSIKVIGVIYNLIDTDAAPFWYTLFQFKLTMSYDINGQKPEFFWKALYMQYIYMLYYAPNIYYIIYDSWT